jgi:3-hydroxyacyl-[acyl-carrier-protein] dehydratase
MEHKVHKNVEAIKELLPHRYPFLLVDRVIEVTPGKSLLAIKNVTINEPFFIGHFPRMAVMPGVLLIEALAQASGVLIYETLGKNDGDLYFLAGIDNVRFKRLVTPGDQLQLYVELTKQRLGVWKFTGAASVNGEVACSAEFTNVKEQRSD